MDPARFCGHRHRSEPARLIPIGAARPPRFRATRFLRRPFPASRLNVIAAAQAVSKISLLCDPYARLSIYSFPYHLGSMFLPCFGSLPTLVPPTLASTLTGCRERRGSNTNRGDTVRPTGSSGLSVAAGWPAASARCGLRSRASFARGSRSTTACPSRSLSFQQLRLIALGKDTDARRIRAERVAACPLPRRAPTVVPHVSAT